MTQQLIDKIKEFEGLRLKAYICPAGKWTIGYGHTRAVKRGQTITKEQAEYFLKDDIRRIEDTLKGMNIKMSEGQMDALTDWCFNFGCQRLKTTTLYKLIIAGAKTEDIQRELQKWVYAKNASGQKVVLKGLQKRRAWEAKRWAE